MGGIKNILACVLVILMASCHKENGAIGTRLVKSISINGNPCTIYYRYDGQGRLSSVTQCDTVETYTYSSDTVYYVKTSGHSLAYQYVYVLDSNSYINSFANSYTSSYTKFWGDGTLAGYRVTYDDAGHPVMLSDISHPNTFVSYVIQGGNQVLETSTSTANNADIYSIISVYYKNTDNQLSNANFGLSFLGKSSANLLKAQAFDSQNGQYLVNYTYQLDNLNGVASRTASINGVAVETRNYTYY